ncbi:MAG: hypothetical protein V1694_04155 [Candidatus Eisenbacteria bacterium]
MKTCSDWPPTEIVTRVLGYKDGRNWVAHCLELDLVGEGPTFRKACEHLKELIEMQIGFAVYRNNAALLYHPAPPEYFLQFDRLYRETLSAFPKPIANRSHAIANLPLRPPKGKAPHFALANA